jgi:hypothetical protein
LVTTKKAFPCHDWLTRGKKAKFDHNRLQERELILAIMVGKDSLLYRNSNGTFQRKFCPNFAFPTGTVI